MSDELPTGVREPNWKSSTPPWQRLVLDLVADALEGDHEFSRRTEAALGEQDDEFIKELLRVLRDAVGSVWHSSSAKALFGDLAFDDAVGQAYILFCCLMRFYKEQATNLVNMLADAEVSIGKYQSGDESGTMLKDYTKYFLGERAIFSGAVLSVPNAETRRILYRTVDLMLGLSRGIGALDKAGDLPRNLRARQTAAARRKRSVAVWRDEQTAAAAALIREHPDWSTTEIVKALCKAAKGNWKANRGKWRGLEPAVERLKTLS